MKLSEMTKEERSLLLFFESAAVDYGGKLSPLHMNGEDQEIKDKWKKSSFIEYGRMKSNDIFGDRTCWVKLSDEAWKLAHEERIARFKRLEYNKKCESKNTGKYGSIQDNKTGSLIVNGTLGYPTKIKHCPMCGYEIPEDRHICEACEFEDRG